jgi:hypothetical protein
MIVENGRIFCGVLTVYISPSSGGLTMGEIKDFSAKNLRFFQVPFGIREGKRISTVATVDKGSAPLTAQPFEKG